MTKLLPNPCCPSPPSQPTSHRHGAHLAAGRSLAVDKLLSTQPHASSAGSHGHCTSTFSFHGKQTHLPFLPAKWGREDQTRAEDSCPPDLWLLPSAPQGSPYFHIELISEKSDRETFGTRVERRVKVKASVNSAPAGWWPSHVPGRDWPGTG